MLNITKIFKFRDIVGKKSFFLGQEIEILKVDEYDEVAFSNNMRGKIANIISYVEDNPKDSYVDIVIDFEPFESYNIPLMESVFFDDKGIPNLTWIESGFYKLSKGTESIYRLQNEEATQEDTSQFKLVSEDKSKLYQQFLSSEQDSYISFLENLALKNIK